MKLEDIGFYTLSDERAQTASSTSRLTRCEVVLTSRCNFKCPYCREAGGQDMDTNLILRLIDQWAADHLYAIRFTGGEPTLHPGLDAMVERARQRGVVRIAVSSNGAARWSRYERLIDLGVNDWSISLDACCAEDGDRMAGGIRGSWVRVVETIRQLSYRRTYVTVGVVLTEDNRLKINDIVQFAASLGPSDIRIIPAAQFCDMHRGVSVSEHLLDRFPILRYRVGNMERGRPVRGIRVEDTHRCRLVLDDMIVNGASHYACVIHFREGGAPIGPITDDLTQMRAVRVQWSESYDTFADPICRKNCIDCLADYNNRWDKFHQDDAV